jgi:hypothetical protein
MPRTNVIVFCEEAYELATQYGSCLIKRVAEEAKARGKTVVETDGDPTAMDNAIAQYDPAVFYGVGHGQCCIFTAKGAVPYIEAAGYSCNVHFACSYYTYSCTQNLRLDKFVGRHVHLMSCVTGLNLGPELVKNGARSFIGYKNLFVVGVSTSGSWPAPCTPPSPNVDVYSFCDSDCEGERVIVRGGSVGEAVNAMKKKFQEYIDKYTRGEWKDWPVAYWASLYLQHNLDNLVAYGDMNFRPCSEAVPMYMAIPALAVIAFPIGVVVAEEGRKAGLWRW